MREWSVYVEIHTDAEVPEDAGGELLDELELFDAAVSCGKGGYSAQMTVSADDLPQAVQDGADVLVSAAALVGLPAGEVVVVEAMTEEEQDRRLDDPTPWTEQRKRRARARRGR